jgi:hypothetical protein
MTRRIIMKIRNAPEILERYCRTKVFKFPKVLITVLFVVGLLATMATIASSGLLTTTSADFACATDLNPAHRNADSTNFPKSTEECEGTNPCGEGSVLWHFVLVQTTSGGISSQLYVCFEDSGCQTVTASKVSGGVIHWNVCTPSDDILRFACTNATGAILNLSHICGGGGGGAARTTIVTEVHLGATDTGTPIVVDNCNGANAPATVHDSALLTASPNSTLLPEGSFVEFFFYNNNDCGGTEVASSGHIDVGGQTTPISLDPYLVRGPLGAGCYSYAASFTSGDTDVVLSSFSDCEPFCVFNAPLTPGYWKTHLQYSKTSKNGPFTIDCLPQSLGNYVVDTTAKATAVWNNMNCSSSSDNDALGCLAGHLLASELNVCNGSAPCIQSTIADANAFLAALGYAGPGGTYTLTAAQRAEAIALKNALDTYNNGGGCPPGSTCD